MTVSSDIAVQEAELNQLILDGQALAAFEAFYAEGVVMQENSDPPTTGKAANRERERALIGNLAAFEAKLLGSAVAANISYSEWIYTFTFRDGQRRLLHEVSARRWRAGQVVHERFYFER